MAVMCEPLFSESRPSNHSPLQYLLLYPIAKLKVPVAAVKNLGQAGLPDQRRAESRSPKSRKPSAEIGAAINLKNLTNTSTEEDEDSSESDFDSDEFSLNGTCDDVISSPKIPSFGNTRIKKSYEDLVGCQPGLKTYPDIGQSAFSTAGLVAISACCIKYILLESDNLSSLFPNAHLNLGVFELNSPHLFAVMMALAVLPTGSFGEIVKACWQGTPVAVKRTLSSLSDDRLIIKDFKHEVNLLVKLRHPNIVQFLGAVTEKKPLMLVAKYLKGGDLHQYLKEKGALNPTTAINFALDIARGMSYLHSEPNVVIHRDLKPRDNYKRFNWAVLVRKHELETYFLGDFEETRKDKEDF
ncbi:probable serine/threonine-protein kinase ddb_g0271538 [Phtheirospermum japonicum]|uniref:Probable serine/threonine-protein kinase ddb_g0271538 n=1 Tax=Phtheirospermum japonicum TaxID=374723 RepID=A0A830C4H9_9LAMI|nr:probable serine/threonine-protein kinase ddb_g0271538 [Phtheirospermum japonicum]